MYRRDVLSMAEMYKRIRDGLRQDESGISVYKRRLPLDGEDKCLE